MELREEAARPTLARKLGDVTHLSPLLRKVRELSGCADEQAGRWLLKCAVARGASHYRRPFDPRLTPDHPALTKASGCQNAVPGHQHSGRTSFICASSPGVRRG